MNTTYIYIYKYLYVYINIPDKSEGRIIRKWKIRNMNESNEKQSKDEGKNIKGARERERR